MLNGGVTILNLHTEELTEKKILLVDDEEDILNVLETVLCKEGFREIFRAVTGEEAIEKAHKINPDLIVLDIMLPDTDGYTVCQELRKFTHAPILFLSAKSDDFDKLLGLSMGGDDYIAKPFSPKEVAYRIKAQFRRMGYSMRQEDEKNAVIEFGTITIDEQKGEVKKVGEKVTLTAIEYQILLLFVHHPNQLLSKETMINHVWGSYFDSYENALMVHIHHLRQKLEEDPSRPKYFLTHRGLGYKFQPDE